MSVAALGAVALAGAAAPATARTLTINVDARDYAFSLSRRSVPAGSTVRFVVRNRGSATHDFVVAKKKRTRMLRPGQRQIITASFPRKGTVRFLCSVSGHARLGMKGAIGVSVKPPPPPPPAPPVDTSDLVSLTRVGTFEQPVLVTAPPGDTERLFVVEHRGIVRIVRDGVVLPDPFLDIREQVTALGESGLLSIAFTPDYATSGLLYVFYNTRKGPYGDLRIAEFRVASFDPDRVDPSSERPVLTIPKPYENHNGGMLQFGPDGKLYASIGDGDPGVLNPAGAFAQRLDVLLGDIIRIEPREGDPYAVPTDNPFAGVAGARAEIWAYGLRNPWRFWIDSETNVLYVPDVGSTSREEINVVARSGRGANFGWPCFEGTVVFDDTATCERRHRATAGVSARGRRLCRHRRRRRPRRAGARALGSLPLRRPLYRGDHDDRRRRRPCRRFRRARHRRARSDELRRRRARARLRHVPPRRRLPARSARALNSATQAAPRSPSQIGVSST